MKIVAACAAIGALLGTLVALVAHFMSHTLPRHYTVGYFQIGREVNVGSPPLVHPSWWPALPAAIAIGIVIGVVGGLVIARHFRAAR